jgi:myo-inositol catabolism protein IolH
MVSNVRFSSLSLAGTRSSALSSHSVYLPPLEVDRKASVTQLRKALAVAGQLECKNIASELSGDIDNPDASRRSFIKSVRELIPYLEEADIDLSFEAHPGDFIEDSFDAVQLLSSFDSDKIRYNYCMAHTFSLGHTPKEIVENARSILGYVHVADSLRPERIFFSPNFHPRVSPHLHMIPGEGDVDFREAFVALKRMAYNGFLTIQPFSSFDDPVRAAEKTRSRMLHLLAELE